MRGDDVIEGVDTVDDGLDFARRRQFTELSEILATEPGCPIIDGDAASTRCQRLVASPKGVGALLLSHSVEDKVIALDPLCEIIGPNRVQAEP